MLDKIAEIANYADKCGEYEMAGQATELIKQSQLFDALRTLFDPGYSGLERDSKYWKRLQRGWSRGRMDRGVGLLLAINAERTKLNRKIEELALPIKNFNDQVTDFYNKIRAGSSDVNASNLKNELRQLQDVLKATLRLVAGKELRNALKLRERLNEQQLKALDKVKGLDEDTKNYLAAILKGESRLSAPAPGDESGRAEAPTLDKPKMMAWLKKLPIPKKGLKHGVKSYYGLFVFKNYMKDYLYNPLVVTEFFDSNPDLDHEGIDLFGDAFGEMRAKAYQALSSDERKAATQPLPVRSTEVPGAVVESVEAPTSVPATLTTPSKPELTEERIPLASSPPSHGLSPEEEEMRVKEVSPALEKMRKERAERDKELARKIQERNEKLKSMTQEKTPLATSTAERVGREITRLGRVQLLRKLAIEPTENILPPMNLDEETGEGLQALWEGGTEEPTRLYRDEPTGNLELMDDDNLQWGKWYHHLADPPLTRFIEEGFDRSVQTQCGLELSNQSGDRQKQYNARFPSPIPCPECFPQESKADDSNICKCDEPTITMEHPQPCQVCGGFVPDDKNDEELWTEGLESGRPEDDEDYNQPQASDVVIGTDDDVKPAKITIRKYENEYRVPGPDNTEEQAYYTEDKDDAIATAKDIYGENVKIKFRHGYPKEAFASDGKEKVCPACGERMKMKYPGNDPESGSARWECYSGHTFCAGCGKIIEPNMGVSTGDAEYHQACIPEEVRKADEELNESLERNFPLTQDEWDEAPDDATLTTSEDILDSPEGRERFDEEKHPDVEEVEYYKGRTGENEEYYDPVTEDIRNLGRDPDLSPEDDDWVPPLRRPHPRRMPTSKQEELENIMARIRGTDKAIESLIRHSIPDNRYADEMTLRRLKQEKQLLIDLKNKLSGMPEGFADDGK